MRWPRTFPLEVYQYWLGTGLVDKPGCLPWQREARRCTLFFGRVKHAILDHDGGRHAGSIEART